jgi:hypothetical protein
LLGCVPRTLTHGDVDAGNARWNASGSNSMC